MANNETTADFVTTQPTSPPFTSPLTTLSSSPPDDVDSTSQGRDSMPAPSIVAVVLSVLAFIIIITVVWYLWRRKKKKEREKRAKEPPPDINTLTRIEEQQATQKKKKKNKSGYSKRSVSIISNDPSSMPNMIAPEPPSEPGYENTQTKYPPKSTKKLNSSKFSPYESAKQNNAKLYSTGDGLEYYVCDHDKGGTLNSSDSKATYKNEDPETSVSSVDEKDYVNVPKKRPDPRKQTPKQDSQELYEPMDIQ